MQMSDSSLRTYILQLSAKLDQLIEKYYYHERQ